MHKVIAIIGLVVLFVALISGMTILFEVVWNMTLPSLFNFPHITFWKAFGLVFLLGFIGGVIRHK